jgi:6-phosphogluconate dehydrogenase
MRAQIGLVGLAVMGENLALNVAGRGIPIAVYNRTAERTDALVAGRARGLPVVATHDLAALAAALERPRRVLLVVKAGSAVDAVLAELAPHLEPGDVVVDGGNSHWRDTDRRIAEARARGLVFVGMGVSGGEEGALRGPSLMPGGDRAAYDLLAPVLTRIAATSDSGPCVTHVGTGSAGHFAKMVHNGIEYGDMQLIAEAYDLLRHGLGLAPREVAATFAEWNAGELSSFLIEVTARVVAFPDDLGTRKVLIDQIDDRAGQKGTGRWTTETALDLGIPVPTITAAVDARLLSALKPLRVAAARRHPGRPRPVRTRRRALVGEIRDTLYAAKICSYAQGFHLLRAASDAFGYGIDLGEVARIWKAGCIIRAAFLDDVRRAFAEAPDTANLLLAPRFAAAVRRRVPAWRSTVQLAVRLGLPAPAMTASLAYLDTIRRPRGTANLIQGQRDFFGAHTYERVDRPGTFHTDWSRAPDLETLRRARPRG